jgi:diacylglycerol kinase family enzyme
MLLRGNVPSDDPHLRVGQCRTLTVEAQRPVLIHLDGEMFATPNDRIQRFEVQLLPRRLLVRQTCVPSK